jgi:hypothetical protein
MNVYIPNVTIEIILNREIACSFYLGMHLLLSKDRQCLPLLCVVHLKLFVLDPDP